MTFDLPNITWLIALAIFGPLILHLTPQLWEERVRDRLLDAPIVIQALLLVMLAILLNQIKGMDVVPFIYFQF